MLGFLACGVAAHGQAISLTVPGAAYTQDFNSLANSGSANTLSITGWFLNESGASANGQYAAGTGSSTTGDMYSFGAAASTERALGQLRSGTLVPIFGASFLNSTGVTVTDLLISYFGEEWRLGTAARADQINFEYSTTATDLVTGTWTAVPGLNFATPDTATTGAKDGNAAGSRSLLSSTVTGLAVANGSTFWIRWTDTDASGSDDGLAVDDFTITPNPAPEPASFVLVAAGIAGLLGSRRRGRAGATPRG